MCWSDRELLKQPPRVRTQAAPAYTHPTFGDIGRHCSNMSVGRQLTTARLAVPRVHHAVSVIESGHQPCPLARAATDTVVRPFPSLLGSLPDSGWTLGTAAAITDSVVEQLGEDCRAPKWRLKPPPTAYSAVERAPKKTAGATQHKVESPRRVLTSSRGKARGGMRMPTTSSWRPSSWQPS